MATPHFKYPFRLSTNGADVLEQDSIEEVAQSVQVLVSTRIGTRVELPTYGIPDQAFTTDPEVNAAVIRSQCAEWEPRAQTALSSSPDEFDELVRRIRLTVTAPDQAANVPYETPGPVIEVPGETGTADVVWAGADVTWAEADFTWGSS